MVGQLISVSICTELQYLDNKLYPLLVLPVVYTCELASHALTCAYSLVSRLVL